ncbi:MAG: HAD-IIB family hydrolase [Bryobacterales bacterium]|nr:HAD-IIB family hydrolase [Bryobacterales bacterium]
MDSPKPEAQERQGLYIVLLSLHGLIRGENLELGRDADTGGQTKYVVELAAALAEDPRVDRVEVMTRLIEDSRVSPDYARPEEAISEKAFVVRVPFGPRRYLKKERLWPHLFGFVDGALQHFRDLGRTPDIVHGHYADAGMVAAQLAALLNVPMVFTGHSLGHEKKRRLLDSGASEQDVERRFNMRRRIDAEETALENAALVVASTKQEAEDQYARYDAYRKTRTAVIQPGVDLSRFRPPRRFASRPPIYASIAKFLRSPERPWILAVSRADERKNIRTLIDAYGRSDELQQKANLVIVAGNRDDVSTMEEGQGRVLRDMLQRIDKYDLYGHAAYPKHHAPEEVPEIYRLAARSYGVFINPALTEPFGLTLLEAAASGVPVVATDDGGPRDILARCKNGVLVDPLDTASMTDALLDALSDRSRWRRWQSSGLRAVDRYYTWKGHAKTYLKEVEKILGRPKRSRYPAPKTLLTRADRILTTDVDNSLLGDPEALAELKRRLAEVRDHVAFGVATGRSLQSAISALRKADAPKPDFWITSVGTEIHYGDHLAVDREWLRNIHWRWDVDAIKRCLGDLPGLELQGRAEQTAYKISYYIDPRQAPPVAEIERTLRRKRLRCKVVFSLGQYLDIIPVRASKGLAIRYLANRWGVPMERVLVTGDCGNDIEMLTGRSLGVVVGNHSDEIDPLREQEDIYFAEAGHAAGILEGVEHYDFFGALEKKDDPEPQA